MTLIDPQEYREAFVQYLRKGTPIRFETKNTKPTTHYIWRTRRDGKVRSSHAEREGQIFSWDDPPEGGHPGEDYGCRCTAEPHLSAIVDENMSQVEKKPKDQIATEARNKRTGNFTYPFGRPYNMTSVVFSIGDTVIGGEFSGSVEERHGVLNVEGSIDFYLRVEFADPADIGVEVIDPGETIFENIHRPLDNYLRGRPGLSPRGPQRLGVQTGEPYSITDDWSGTLSGQIYLAPARSAYG